MEQPDLALQRLRAALRPGSRTFVNAPNYSPAPDRIQLWRTTEEFAAFVGALFFPTRFAR